MCFVVVAIVAVLEVGVRIPARIAAPHLIPSLTWRSPVFGCTCKFEIDLPDRVRQQGAQGPAPYSVEIFGSLGARGCVQLAPSFWAFEVSAVLRAARGALVGLEVVEAEHRKVDARRSRSADRG
jgi:hypothetical protein